MPPPRRASTVLDPVEIITTDSLLTATSVAVMMVEGRSFAAASLIFSTLASLRPCEKSVRRERVSECMPTRREWRHKERSELALILSIVRREVILMREEQM